MFAIVEAVYKSPTVKDILETGIDSHIFEDMQLLGITESEREAIAIVDKETQIIELQVKPVGGHINKIQAVTNYNHNKFTISAYDGNDKLRYTYDIHILENDGCNWKKVLQEE